MTCVRSGIPGKCVSRHSCTPIGPNGSETGAGVAYLADYRLRWTAHAPGADIVET
jgi:hypothetical protein